MGHLHLSTERCSGVPFSSGIPTNALNRARPYRDTGQGPFGYTKETSPLWGFTTCVGALQWSVFCLSSQGTPSTLEVSITFSYPCLQTHRSLIQKRCCCCCSGLDQKVGLHVKDVPLCSDMWKALAEELLAARRPIAAGLLPPAANSTATALLRVCSLQKSAPEMYRGPQAMQHRFIKGWEHLNTGFADIP